MLRSREALKKQRADGQRKEGEIDDVCVQYTEESPCSDPPSQTRVSILKEETKNIDGLKFWAFPSFNQL